jgi:hypothetical protein
MYAGPAIFPRVECESRCLALACDGAPFFTCHVSFSLWSPFRGRWTSSILKNGHEGSVMHTAFGPDLPVQPGVFRHSLYEVRLGISFFLFEDESNGLSVLRERGDWCHVDEEI